MKWNSPPVLLMAATIGAVALMAVAHAKSPADCSQLSLAQLYASADADDDGPRPGVTEAIRNATSPEDAALRYWEILTRRAFPRCPSPLPADAVFIDDESGETIPVDVARDDFVRTMSYIMQFAMAAENAAP